MNLIDQVCSLEYAKKLKELGVKQQGFFAWGRQDGFKEWELELYCSNPELQRMGRSYYVAFSVAELGQILRSIKFIMIPPYKNNETEADTRAKLLIDILEKREDLRELLLLNNID